MSQIFAWVLVVAVFLLAAEGFNLIRLSILDKMANPNAHVLVSVLVGIVLMVGGIAFLGGLIRHRENKRKAARRGASSPSGPRPPR